MWYRPYDPSRDQAAVNRMWQEVGWISSKDPADIPERQILAGAGLVAEVGGEAECLVIRASGDLAFLDERLPFACITGVTTSRVARKLSLAGRLTAASIAAAAEGGAAVCGLGMFEQGFYNRLGFGTGSYEVTFSFDPSTMLLDAPFRVPLRLGTDDLERIHRCRLQRRRAHGSCSLTPSTATLTAMHWSDNPFGLGYADGAEGELSHFVWLGAERGENGPYNVAFMAYQTDEQLRELLGLLKALGDQVFLVHITEPPGIQLQDFMAQPNRRKAVSEGGKFAVRQHCHAWWQMRMCDLPACLAKTHLPGPAIRFNLKLTDPVVKYLDAAESWQGIGGEYVVTLGPQSEAHCGSETALPTLEASVGAFTRLWLGVRPATGLAFTDQLSGPPELLTQLDNILRLPSPQPDWHF